MSALEEGNTSSSAAFELVSTRRADVDIRDAVEWLLTIDAAVAERFEDRLQEVLVQLCKQVADEIAQGGRPADIPHEAGTLYFSRPVYRLRFQTGNTPRARRSSTGLWYVYYTVDDFNRDGKPDTVTLQAVKHAASTPFTIEADTA